MKFVTHFTHARSFWGDLFLHIPPLAPCVAKVIKSAPQTKTRDFAERLHLRLIKLKLLADLHFVLLDLMPKIPQPLQPLKIAPPPPIATLERRSV